MRLSIKHKLFLAILSAHMIMYITMYSIGRYNFDRGFLEYVSRIEERQVPALIEGLSDYYAHTGSWDPIVQNTSKWSDLIRESIASADEGSPTARSFINRPRPGNLGSNDWYYASEYSPARPYLQLLDADQRLLIGSERALPLATLTPITVWGEAVGYLAVTSRQELSEVADLLFSEQQKESFLVFAVVLVIISGLIAFPLASYMVRPIHALVTGTRSLTSGDYSSRIDSNNSDELGQLAGDFNTMALTLEQNQHARQQWIADIAHELRTPLAILQGELEAIQDGVRPLTREALDSLHNEVVHLNVLVNDLHELSLSDMGALVYKKARLNLISVLENSLELYQQSLERENISLKTRITPYLNNREIDILGDAQRLQQLFANLLQNTCRYTDKGGQLQISLEGKADHLLIEWEDSAPGVSEEHLDKLFDRLYRVESSRNRAEGGSGLGLAICKNIVEAHEGTIKAASSPLGGLKLSIRLPVEQRR